MADRFSEQFIKALETNDREHDATSPRVMKLLADRKITLNVCPTSNIMLGYANTLTAKQLDEIRLWVIGEKNGTNN